MAQVRVVLKSVWDDKAFKDAQKSIATFNSGLDRAFRGVAVAAAAAAAAAAVFAKDAISAASNLEESTNAVNVAFGSAAEAVLAIGESSAKSLGVARSEFNQAAVRFSAFAERVVGQGGDVAGFIGEITQRAADFASVFNIDVSEALRVFQSGLSGEAEPLKRFGINLLDSEVKAYALRAGIISVGEAMTETQKVQARFGLLMEATSKTQGDFANTSESLANQQRILRATFTDLQAEIGTALLPVVSALVKQIADFLLPRLEQFGNWLKSPEGEKAIRDFGDALAGILKAAFDFASWVTNNIKQITDYGIAIGIAAVAFRTMTAAVQVASAAVAIFNSVAGAGVFFAIAAGIAAIAAGMYLVYQNTKDATEAIEEQRREILKTESAFETVATNGSSAYKGLIPGLTYATTETKNLGGATWSAASHMAELNNLSLQRLRDEVSNSAGELNRFRNIAASITGRSVTAPPPPTFTAPKAAKGESEAEKARKAQKEGLEKARKIIADATKELNELQTENTKALLEINNNYADNVAKVTADFQKRLLDIVQQSQDRLRDAYRNAVAVNISDLFGRKTTQKVITEVKKLTANIQTTISRETEVVVGGSVSDLVAGLKERLTKSQALLQNSASLASQGFSQTFIEQVVGAGVETGNELAKAILEATPETQKELKDLFTAVETQAETGMDALAKSIYDKAGLATRELKTLYNNTVIEQADALVELKEQLDKDLLDTNTKFADAVAKLREKFQEDLAAIKTDISSLKNEIQALIDKMNELAGLEVTAPSIPQTAAPSIPSVPKPTTPKAGTTVNVNVRTDPTKSAAETGRQVAKVVNKYTGGGGGLRGVGVIAV